MTNTPTAQPAVSDEAILLSLQNSMVQRAEQLVRDLRLTGAEGNEKGRTQASKAIEVAQSAPTLLVFVNWVRYQAGREKSAEFWTRSNGQKTLAKALADDLGWLQGQVANELKQQPRARQDAVTMRAVVRFLGYFRRALIGAAYLDSIRLEAQP